AIDLPTLKADRRPVLPGGLAILTAVVESFGVDRVSAVDGGLREGVLYDLHGRFQHDDVRDRTVWSFLRRFQVDEAQARRVEATAARLWSAIAAPAKLEDPFCRRLLGWSARLHEVGLAISHVGYHRHGEYLIRHARMDGFAQNDQTSLSILVRLHRKKWANELDDGFRHLGRDVGRWLVVILRLAVLLNRSRDGDGAIEVNASVEGNTLALSFGRAWLEAHPVTEADLAKEASVLAAQGYDLLVRGR
ncbi:MAG: exopolyphosphatase, partial [Planctomycetota bacterium]